jgi:hypothetical protein
MSIVDARSHPIFEPLNHQTPISMKCHLHRRGSVTFVNVRSAALIATWKTEKGKRQIYASRSRSPKLFVSVHVVLDVS